MRLHNSLTHNLRWWVGLTLLCLTLVGSSYISNTLQTPALANNFNNNLAQNHFVATCNAGNNDIGGVIFRDYNANGVQDSREPGYGTTGMVVRLFGVATSAPIATASVEADGSYVFAGHATSDPFRLELVGLPDYLEMGAMGGDSESGVRFVSTATCSADFSVNNGGDYCQADPDVATSCFVYDATDSIAGDTVISFASTAGTTPNDTVRANYDISHVLEAIDDQTGSVYGIAYQPETGNIFASAYLKRHVFFGPGGTGAIYRITPSGTITTYADLNALFPNSTGADPHPAGSTNLLRDDASFPLIGKRSLGDLDMTEDGKYLFVINMNNRQLYKLPADSSTPLTSSAGIRAYPDFNSPGNDLADLVSDAGNCPDPDQDARPFGLGIQDGKLYVGMICSAESTSNRWDMRGYVFQFDIASETFASSAVLDFPITPSAYRSANQFKDWSSPWPTCSNTSFLSSPQPMISDIGFDNGDMLIGLRDRFGDQIGNEAYAPTSAGCGDSLFSGVAMGDILRACDDGSGGWSLESDGNCGSITTAGSANNGQGPGDGEYFYQDNYDSGTVEIGGGGIVQIPGDANMMSVVADPIYKQIGDDNGFDTSRQGGIHWYGNSDGTRQKAGVMFESPATPSATFGKANGLGDLEAICLPAPLEIGNRLWCDTNADGVQSPIEADVGAGVAVSLNCGGNNVYATTDNDGVYKFTDAMYASSNSNALIPRQTECTISVRVNSGSTNAGKIATACSILSVQPTLSNVELAGDGNDDARDSDGVLNGVYTSVTFTSGESGENNHSYDFGFVGSTPVGAIDLGDLPDSFDTIIVNNGARHNITSALYLGGCVDGDADGQVDPFAGMKSIGGDDNHAGGFIQGSCSNDDDEDGVQLITPIVPSGEACLAVTANVPSGNAQLNGWIDFNGDGDFVADPTDQLIFTRRDSTTLNNVNGTVPAGNSSYRFCFNVPATATYDGGETHMRFRLSTAGSLNYNGLTTNGEVEDYWQPLACVGNYVWFDQSPDGIQQSSETGLNGIGVNLVWGGTDGDVATTADNLTYSVSTTNDGIRDGKYQFCGLLPDDGSNNANYRVEIPVPSVQYAEASPANAGINDERDSDGTQIGGAGTAVVGPIFTIPTSLNLPTNEAGNGDNPGKLFNYPDQQDNLTFDFGFASVPTSVQMQSFGVMSAGISISALFPLFFVALAVLSGFVYRRRITD